MSSDNLPLYLEPIPDHNPPNNTLYLVPLSKFLNKTSLSVSEQQINKTDLTSTNFSVTINDDEMMQIITEELVCEDDGM